jgi:hypothetical protein
MTARLSHSNGKNRAVIDRAFYVVVACQPRIFKMRFLSFVFNFAEFPRFWPRSGLLSNRSSEIEAHFSLGLGCEQASLMLPTFYPCPDRPEHPMQICALTRLATRI